MSKPIFSVVTIAWNVEVGLRTTAATLAQQTFRDFEWIIIDGGSTDGTEVFAREQFANGTAVGISERDAGLYDAMNKGLARAIGDYVVFLNAGDCFLDGQSLAIAASKLKETEYPDIGFFGSLMDFGDRRIVRSTKSPSYIWHGQPGLHQATFYRREMHQRFPFNDRYKVVGDYEVLARMARAGATMKSFDAIIGINEFEANATSGRNKTRLLREAVTVQREVLKLPSWKIAVSVIRRSAASMVFKVLTTLHAIRLPPKW